MPANKVMLVATGVATAVASLVFAVAVFGYLSPPEPTMYDRVKHFDEVQNFLEKYRHADITESFYDCDEVCPEYRWVTLSYWSPDPQGKAQLTVYVPQSGYDLPYRFEAWCKTGDQDSPAKLTGERIENITGFLNSDKCPAAT